MYVILTYSSAVASEKKSIPNCILKARQKEVKLEYSKPENQETTETRSLMHQCTLFIFGKFRTTKKEKFRTQKEECIENPAKYIKAMWMNKA